MTPYELELVAIAKNRGDSVTRQLAEILQKQDAQIEELETGLKNVWKVVEGKQTEIDRLNYDLDGFKQNFFVSGFHLQIKMANEQLVKQQAQIDKYKQVLESIANEYVELSHDKIKWQNEDHIKWAKEALK